MAYVTQADLETRFGIEELAQLTDRAEGLMPDAAVVERALADAEAEIDGYLAARYQLPLVAIPAVLIRLAADIARYRLYDDRATEAVRKRYEDAVRDLKAVAAGTVVLDAAMALPPAASGIAVKVSAPSRVFGTDSLAGY